LIIYRWEGEDIRMHSAKIKAVIKVMLIQPTSFVSWKCNDNFASKILHISNNIPYQTKEPTNRMKSGIE